MYFLEKKSDHTGECIALCHVYWYLVISSWTTLGSLFQFLSENLLHTGHIKVVRGQFGQSQYAREIRERIILAQNSIITKFLLLLFMITIIMTIIIIIINIIANNP